MATYLKGKSTTDDLGAYGNWFARGYEDAPAPMPKIHIGVNGSPTRGGDCAAEREEEKTSHFQRIQNLDSNVL